MGFYGPIPANKLAAQYDVTKKLLTLYAEGVVREFTYGISFRQDTQWVGGLKFYLGGWTGPIGPKEQPYTHSQSFSMILPNPVVNSKYVIIVTANHPKGVEVPIHYLGIIHPGADLVQADKAEKALTAEGPATLSPNDIHMNVLFKEPFIIKAAARVPDMGTVTIDFDPTMLVLLDASINNNDIVWTFNSLKTGDTQIAVTTRGGIAQYVMVTNYDVRIFVL